MKKIILFFLGAMLTTSLSAQTKPWKIALHVDPNVSWIKPDSKYITAGDNKLNFGFGVSIDKMFTDNYAIGTGFNVLNTGGALTYYKYGATEDGARAISLLERTYKLRYLEIPVTLKLRTKEIGYITYWAQVGVGLGVNIRSKSDETIDYKKLEYQDSTDNTTRWLDATSVTDQSIEDEDIADDISIFRAGLIVAGGIEYNLAGDASIVAGVCFNNAFTNILKGQGVASTNNEPEFNLIDNSPKQFDLKGISNALSLQVGILF